MASRRAFPHLLGCIRAVALLRQRQKKEADGVIKADLMDYAIAYGVMVQWSYVLMGKRFAATML
jgi:hypothetical protein